MRASNTDTVLYDVGRERQAQRQKWGNQSHDQVTWIAILTEEVGEAAQEALGLKFGREAAKSRACLREELVQVAAVAVAAIETLDYGVA